MGDKVTVRKAQYVTAEVAEKRIHTLLDALGEARAEASWLRCELKQMTDERDSALRRHATYVANKTARVAELKAALHAVGVKLPEDEEESE